MYPARSSSRFICLLAGAAGLLLPSALFGQGCVIARGGGSASSIMDGADYLHKGHWETTLAFRWFESHRHYAGAVEQTQRDTQGTEVINNSYFYDFTVTYALTDRLILNLTLPYVHHDRDSLYEHLGNNSGQRFTTHSSGLADLRASAEYWLWDPAKKPKGNISFGLGVKAPTGEYDVTDIFHRPTGLQTRYVDSSIQPGDGGWGWFAGLEGFRSLGHNWTVYGNAFYLFNPEGRVEETGFSIPDAYMARGGFDYALPIFHGWGTTVSLGARIEGVPGNDAFGNSRGSRRPGFATAVEPGFTFFKGKFSGVITVPILVHANRTTTYGQKTAGDAAFADFTINSSITYRF